MNPKKEAALQQLEKAVTELGDLSHQLQNNAFSEEFLRWRRTTHQALISLFGKDSPHVAQFENLNFTPLVIDGNKLPDSAYRAAYYGGLDNARCLLLSIKKELVEQWPNDPEPPPASYLWLRVILALLCAGAGYGALFLPQVRTWQWLLHHPNRLGLYLAYVIIVASLVWALLDLKRWRFVLVTGTFGTLLIIVQIVGR